ncbi:MAG: peptidyl-dipeptidase Dcp [Terracidiphilus sp.]
MTMNAAIAQKTPVAFGPQNPFYAPSSLPYQTPPFDKIKDADFQPAIEAGMKAQLAEVEAIANSAEAPTFENTLVALEKSGQLLSRVMLAFNCLTTANTNPELQKVQEYEAPRLAAHQDSITLNAKLFARIETLYNTRETLHLDAESLRLLEYQYKEFVLAGARLNEADKARLKKINEEDSTLSTNFESRLLAGSKQAAFATVHAADLDGLSAAEMASAAEAAKERKLTGWVLPMQNTTQQPVLAELTNRATRKAIFERSLGRNEQGDANDTRAIIARLAQIRAEKAKLLGFENFADWTLADQMAQKPAAAIGFVDALVPATVAKANREAAELQAAMDAEKGGFKLEPWDWAYYAEKVRKAKFEMDESQVKPYFELNNVLQNGVFYAANLLYGITFKERKDLPVYQSDMRVFEVFNADGKPMALFYCDYFKRDNKNGGAWMNSLVTQSKLLGQLPVVINVANFDKPAPGQPALLSFDDVTTMFHEFGHGLHGLFANTMYPSLSGTQTPRDFVEFPSQFNEHWASYPPVFDHFARHYKTGEPMPAELVTKIKNAAEFNQGFKLAELLEAASLDLEWHTLPSSAPLQDPDAFEKQALERKHLLLSAIPPRYRSSYFLHIWTNGYSAGYYAYLWTEMLDDDAYQWFEEHGGATRANGDRFRQMVLSRGNTEDLEKLYENWRGAKPSIEPMLVDRGLKDGVQ